MAKKLTTEKITKKSPIENKKSKKVTRLKKETKKQFQIVAKIKSQKVVKRASEKAEKQGAKSALKVRFLGGVGEIGKNMTALEYGKDIILIDAGLSFPNESMPGIDLVIPDSTFLVQNKSKIKGIIITHGHEDHIGGLPYLLKEINAPIYGTKLTLTLIENKLIEHKIDNVALNCIKPSSTIKLGNFSVEFINVNHSIAGAVALSITTPVGVVFTLETLR